ncbi:MAG: stage V sporulation protein AC [Clostridia bacterium]|nr:stage V sporulation protein AC [Clostridia bacterium]
MPNKDKNYQKLADKYSPPSPKLKNCCMAFLFGGAICTVGQAVMNTVKLFADEEASAIWTSVIMVFLGALLTGVGVYDSMAKHAGAGTLVPITGFANSVVSPALEFKTEGMITGVAAKMFIIAGPVIVYGVLTSAVCGLIKWIFGVI